MNKIDHTVYQLAIFTRFLGLAQILHTDLVVFKTYTPNTDYICLPDDDEEALASTTSAMKDGPVVDLKLTVEIKGKSEDN